MLVGEIPILRDQWYALALASEARRSGPAPVRLFGEDYVLWASSTGIFSLVQPRCPHRGAHLASGTVVGDHLACCYHGWQFDHTGACQHIPQLEPGIPIPPKARLRTWPVVERYGLVWGCVGTPTTQGPPRWHEAEELGWRVHVDFFETWKVCAPRIIDNNIDQSHPAFVHQGTFGDPSMALVPRYNLERTVQGFRFAIEHDVRGVGPQMGITDEEKSFRRMSEIELLDPVHTRILLAYGGAAPDYCFYGSATPLDDEHSLYIRLSALAGDEQVQPYEQFHAYSRRVTLEDRAALETTEADFPLDITAEVHLRCDRSTLEYRRVLASTAKTTLSSEEPVVGDASIDPLAILRAKAVQ